MMSIPSTIKKSLATLVVATGLVLGAAAAANAEPTFYDDNNYAGGSWAPKLASGVTGATTMGSWNDRASSLKATLTWYYYENTYYAGQVTICEGNVNSLGAVPGNWNDRISSFKKP